MCPLFSVCYAMRDLLLQTLPNSNTGHGIDIILSLNIQQECIHFLIAVEKKYTNFQILGDVIF
jgi:hypothetical protein